MALTQQHRNVVYNAWVPDLGEEVAEALISHFPARDLDEPVTKEFVEVKIAEVRTEIAGVRTEVADLRGEMRAESGKVRTEMHQEIGGLRKDLQHVLMWMVGAVFTSAGFSLAISQALS